MRQKRAKSYRKQMFMYSHLFNFREPYQVLVDAEIILDAINIKMNLVHSIERTIQSKVKLMITQCSMQKLYDLENNEFKEQAIDLAKTFERRRCGHKDKSTALPEAQCIIGVVNVKGNNKHRYIVATQNVNLRAAFRRIPLVPLIYISRSVMLLEPMSPATMTAKMNLEQKKLSSGLNSAHRPNTSHNISSSSNILLPEDSVNPDSNSLEPQNKVVKRTGPKGANPLSIKKKRKINPASVTSSDSNKSKRKKRHHSTRSVDKQPENVTSSA